MYRHLMWQLSIALIAGGIFLAAILTPPKVVQPLFSAAPVVLEAAPVQATSTTWTMNVVGDIMLDRNVWQKIKVSGNEYPFSVITPELTDADVVLANLEGPFTSSTHHAVSGGSLIFNFDPSLAPILRSAGLTTVSLANNHTLNQGQAGLDSTREALKKAGVEFFGDPKNQTGYHLTKTINGQTVTFLGYHGLVDGLATVISDVRTAHAKGEYVIVMPHSGTEYNLKFTTKQQGDYHQLIDAGADVILAAHPHVVEPLEIYKGKFIAYSLGNFVFDQYFSSDTQIGLMLKMTFTGAAVEIKLVPLDLTKSQPKSASDTLRQQLLNRLAATSVASEAQRDMIRQGQLTLTTP